MPASRSILRWWRGWAGRCRTAARARTRRPCRRACAARRRAGGEPGRRAPWPTSPFARPLALDVGIDDRLAAGLALRALLLGGQLRSTAIDLILSIEVDDCQWIPLRGHAARRGHHGHPRQPAGARAALARIEELGVERVYCGGDLVGYGPHPERGLRADRASAASRRSTATTTTRSRATSRTAAAPTSRRTTASSGSARSSGPSPTPTRRSKDFMRGLPFDLRFELGDDASTSSTAPRARSTSTCSRTSRPALRAARRGRGGSTSGLRPHPQAVDPRVRRRAVRQLRLGRKAQGRRSARRVRVLEVDRGRRWRLDRARRVRRPAVPREVAAAGLPGEFGDKLVLAA